MAQQVLITIRGGMVTGVSSDGPIEVTVVDYDNIKAGDAMPPLPRGVGVDDDGDLTFQKPWEDAPSW